MNNIMLFNDPKVKKFVDMIKMVEYWTLDNNLAISHTMMRLFKIIRIHRPDHSRLDLKDFLDNPDNMEMICEMLTYSNIEYTCHFFNLIDETFPGTSLNYVIHMTDKKDSTCQILHERLVFFKHLDLMTTIFSPTRSSLINILLGNDEPVLDAEQSLAYPNNPPQVRSVGYLAEKIFTLTQNLKKQVKYRDNDDTVATLNLIDMELLTNSQTRANLDVKQLLNLTDSPESEKKKPRRMSQKDSPVSIASASVKRKTIINKQESAKKAENDADNNSNNNSDSDNIKAVKSRKPRNQAKKKDEE
jgi:hypothetical protein